MKLDNSVLYALRNAIEALDEKNGAMPANVLRPLIAIAKPGMRLHLDLGASDIVGAPVVSVERTASLGFLAPLTARQKEVALLVIDGLSNDQIAGELGITVATVKDHVHAILDRLDMSSRRSLMVASRF